MSVSLLLVGPDAGALAGPLAEVLAGLDVLPAETVAAARAYLAGTRFDAVALRHDAEDADALRELAAGLGVGRLLTYRPGSPQSLAADLGPKLGLAPLVRAAPAAPAALTDSLRATLADLRAEIGKVAHDLANPLAIVAGNAQLGAELARQTGADPAIADAFDDIDAAGRTLAGRLSQLAALRARLDAFT